MVMKFLAGMVLREPQTSPEEKKEAQELIDRFWGAASGNVDGKLEVCIDDIVIFLMHLLSQSKSRDGGFDNRIQNLDKMVSFVDNIVCNTGQDLVKWEETILKSGYISKSLCKKVYTIIEKAGKYNSPDAKIARKDIEFLINDQEIITGFKLTEYIYQNKLGKVPDLISSGDVDEALSDDKLLRTSLLAVLESLESENWLVKKTSIEFLASITAHSSFGYLKDESLTSSTIESFYGDNDMLKKICRKLLEISTDSNDGANIYAYDGLIAFLSMNYNYFAKTITELFVEIFARREILEFKNKESNKSSSASILIKNKSTVGSEDDRSGVAGVIKGWLNSNNKYINKLPFKLFHLLSKEVEVLGALKVLVHFIGDKDLGYESAKCLDSVFRRVKKEEVVEIFNLLKKWACDQNEHLRKCASWGLEKIVHKLSPEVLESEQVESVIGLLQDVSFFEDQALQKQVEHVLLKFLDKQLIHNPDILEKVLRACLGGDNEGDLSGIAGRVLIKTLGRESGRLLYVIDILKLMSCDDNKDVRESIVFALTQIFSRAEGEELSRIISLLKDLSKDNEWNVRCAVGIALSELISSVKDFWLSGCRKIAPDFINCPDAITAQNILTQFVQHGLNTIAGKR
jgi:hypothetical protein